MNGKQLKNSILQWAIQGKLVPQDPNDEPASVLLEKIRAEKARLIKEGKIKKDKKESIIYRGEDNSYYEKFADGKVVCIDDEIPFEIPESWTWGRLSNMVLINPKNYVDDNKEAAFIPMEKIEATYLSSYTYTVRKWREIKSGYTHFADGDVAFAKITPCFQNRKSMILNNLPNGIGAGTTELKVLRPYRNTLSVEYLLFFLESPYFVEEAVFKGTANQQRIISGYLENKLFPLPPLNEQRSIAEKIKKSIVAVEQYGKVQDKLEDLNNNLNTLLKKSVLQEAIQGKLVPQDPNDEPASVLLQHIKEEKQRLVKEGRLKKKDIVDSIIYKGDDNKYYPKLPKGWVMCKLSDVCKINSGFAFSSNDYCTEGIPLVRISNIKNNTIDLSECVFIQNTIDNKFLISKGDLLIAMSGATTGKIGIYDKNSIAYLNQRVGNVKILSNTLLLPEYRNIYMLSKVNEILNIAYGGAQPNISTSDIENLDFMLPPLSEQKRIVTKVEDLLRAINTIVGSL